MTGPRRGFREDPYPPLYPPFLPPLFTALLTALSQNPVKTPCGFLAPPLRGVLDYTIFAREKEQK